MLEPTGFEKLLFEFSKLLQWIASGVWGFLNTPFGLTLIGTSVAAFAGVYGAHKILDRKKRRDDLLRELRITNAAIMVSFEICNSFLSLKKQQVKELGLNYERQRTSLEKYQQERRRGELPPNAVFAFEMDFKSMNPMLMPSEILVKQVFEEISTGARALALTNTLVRTIDSLNRLIGQRNELIDIFKNKAEATEDERANFYFGLPDPNGHVDRSYPDTVEGICSYTDDCIQFSKLLCGDLVVVSQGWWKIGESA